MYTGNSARSILAESLLNHWGRGRFRGFSAGSFPKGQVHPFAVDLLNRMNLPAESLRSKSWDESAAPGASPIDFIFTVCDNAAVEGSDVEKAAAFRKAFKELETRIKLFTSLPIGSFDGMTLQSKLRNIGNSDGATKPT